jgi:predicted AAA+ superfamily ATPase
MPHLRKRYIEARIKKSMSFSSVVGVLGQRQVGKTTLLEGLAATYSTFDREKDLLEAENNPSLFLEQRRPPFAIDESQICPRIFPAIKEAVRLKKTPGQFLLSGSVRFTSRKIIRESLTGRIVNLEVLPFTIRESHSFPISQFFKLIQKVRDQSQLEDLFKDKKVQSENAFWTYLETGGLPGICFFRESYVRNQKFESHIDTLLNRDIHLVVNTTLPYTSLRSLLKFLALKQGISFDLKEAAEYSQISTVTLKRILFAFESLFLIRAITSIGPEKKTTYFLEDQGMATWIAGTSENKSNDILRGIYSNLRQEFFYDFELNGTIHHYRTKNGVNVPLVFQYEGGLVGIIPCSEAYPSPKTLGSATAFLKKHGHAIAIIAINGNEPIAKTDRLFLVPYYWLV